MISNTLPRYSLIIPAYNEEAYLPRLLDSVDRARLRYHAGAASIEVIVADNGSTDRTAQIGRSRGCGVVAVEKRMIAAVRNGGARTARGEILGFVDADIQIHPDTFNEIDRALAGGKVVGGATGMRFERSSVGLTCTYGVLMLLGALIRLSYGARPALEVDTGVVFCRRCDFEEIAGYDEKRFFAEDVQLLLALGRLGRKRGEQLARGTNARAVFSTRKFDKYGDWHYFTAPFRLPWSALYRPSSMNTFVRRYWYEGR
jgi:glycosyltransferase involved in cell wall biosynthesis